MREPPFGDGPATGPRPVTQLDPAPLPFTSQWSYELTFPGDPRGPGIVRVTVRAVLAAHGLGELTDRAELLSCELATNSVRHTKGPAGVRLHWLYPVLRGSVWDPAPELPGVLEGGPVAVLPPSSEVEAGRGLFLLDAVADRWGGCAMGEEGSFGPGGKSLWFELVLPGQPPAPALAA